MAIDSLSGRSFGVYQLRELLGSGGMGAVYHAYQTNLEREVAIKVLPPALLVQPDYTERFFREAKVAASLEHPHIVPVYDYGTFDGISYIVMRLLMGGSLSERLYQRVIERRPLPACSEITDLLNQLGSALDYAHKRGVIHRDIKPSNIMFDSQGMAYLVDFGIAKLVGETTTVTDPQIKIGTPTHMAPEQWTDQPLTPNSDQYSLAVVIFNLLTGKLPFMATTPQAFMYKHLNEKPPPTRALRYSVPEAAEPVLQRALAKSPQERFETVTAFARAFAAATASDSDEPTGFLTFPLQPMPLVTTITDTETDSENARGQSASMPPSLTPLVTLPFEKTDPVPETLESQPEAAAPDPTPKNVPRVPTAPETLPHAPQYAPPDARAKIGIPPPSPAVLTSMPPISVQTISATPAVKRPSSQSNRMLLGAGAGFILLIVLIGLGLTIFRPENSRENAQTTRAVPTVAATVNIPLATSIIDQNPTVVAIVATNTPALRPSPTWTNTVLPRTTAQPSITPLPAIGATSVPLLPTSTAWFGGFRTAIPSNATSIAGQFPTAQATPIIVVGPDTTQPASQSTAPTAAQVPRNTPIVIADAALSPDRITVENAASLVQITSLQPGELVTVRGVAAGGGLVAAAVSDGSIALWDVNGAPAGTLRGHNGVVQAVTVSRDGRLVAAGGDDGTVRIWDANGNSRAVLYGHTAPVRAIAFSPDGSLLASASEDFTVRLWDVNTGASLAVLEGHDARVMGVAFSPDGTTLASAGEDNQVRLWDVAAPIERGQLIGHTDAVRAVAYSPDGSLIVTGSTDGTVRLWDAANGTLLNTFQGHESWVFSVAFSPDGTLIASGGRDQTARLWDVASGQQLTVLTGHGGWVLGVAFSSDGAALASGSGDGLLRLWRVTA